MELPDFEARTRLIRMAKDKHGNPSFLKAFFLVLSVIVLVSVAESIPEQLAETDWAWLKEKIDNSHLWKTLYGVIFCIIFIIIIGIPISIYEFFSRKP